MQCLWSLITHHSCRDQAYQTSQLCC